MAKEVQAAAGGASAEAAEFAATAKPTRLLSLGAVVLTASYLGMLALFAALDLWQTRFFEAGPSYVLYNFLRVLFLSYLFLICSTLGNLVLARAGNGHYRATGSFDGFLITSYVGVAVVITGMLALGLCQLYYQALALLITTPLVYLSFGTVQAGWAKAGRVLSEIRWWSASPRDTGESPCHLAVGLLFLVAAGLLVFQMVYRGLGVDATPDSVDHYCPSYVAVIEQHGLRTNHYVYEFFYTKGAGLHYLCILLTDVHSFQVTSFYLGVLCLLVVYRMTLLAGGGRHLWAMLAAVLVLSSSLPLTQEYQKLHPALGSLIVFLAYLLTYRLAHDRDSRGSSFVPGVVLCAATITAPVSPVFLLPFVVICLGTHWLLGSGPRLSQAIALVSVPPAVFGLIALVNYQATGLFEITPVALWNRFANEVTMRGHFFPPAWWEAHIGALGEYYGAAQGTLTLGRLTQVFSRKKLWDALGDPFPLPGPWAFFLLAILILVAWRLHRGNRGARLLILCSLFVIGLCLLITEVIEQNSASRFLSFRTYFRILLGICLLLGVCRLTAGSRWEHSVNAAAALLAAWIGGRSFLAAVKPHARLVCDACEFVCGSRSYVDMYRSFGAIKEIGAPMRQHFGADVKIHSLSSFCGLESLPGGQWRTYPFFLGDIDRIMAGAPADARSLLASRHGYTHFVADLSPDAPQLGLLAYAPLFQPESLRENFQIAARLNATTYVLTWRSSPPSQFNEMDEIARLFQKKMDLDQVKFKYFPAWMRIYRTRGMVDIKRHLWDARPELPRLALFASWSVEPDSDRTTERFRDARFDPRAEVILAADPGIQPGRASPCSPVEILSEGSGFLEAEVMTEAPAVVWLMEEYAPFWEAEVAGRPVPILRAHGAYMAVPIPAGRHRLVFRYRDHYWRLGVACYAGGLVAAIALFYLARRREKRLTAP